MIFSIIQTRTNFDLQWEITGQAGNPIATAVSPFEKGRFQINIAYPNEVENQRLYFNPSDTTWGTKLSDRFSFKLFKHNEKVGHLVGKTKKVGFLKSYAYYEFPFEGTMYYGYEVGFGKKGLFLCVYREDSLIAIVDKTLRVVNYRDTYTAYLENAEDSNIIIPFVLYYDSIGYDDLLEVSIASVKEKRVNTIQPELLAKYDETFIPRIKQMDGIQ